MTDEEKPAPYRRKAIGVFAIVTPEIYSNPKVRKSGPYGLVTFQFALTRNAARGRTGAIPASDMEPWYIADQTMISLQQAEEGLQRAIAADLLYPDIEGETEVIRIDGWDETWARQAINDSERRVRDREKQKQREKQNQTENQKESETKTQTQKKRSPDKSGQGSGVWDLARPATKAESDQAAKILRRLTEYTGNPWTSGQERNLVVGLLRSNHNPLHLECLVAYQCDDDGRGFLNRTDSDGHYHLRQHLVPFKIFDEKTIREHLAAAVGWVSGGGLDTTDPVTFHRIPHELRIALHAESAKAAS